MAGRSIKAPPTFSEGDDYLAWKNDISVWEMFTEYSEAKRGPAVYLSLVGKARDAIREIPAANLANAEGVKTITDRLDQIYLKDKNTQAYMNFKDFYEYRRSQGETFNQFIVEFEKLYTKITQYDMVLPSGVKAFFLLQAANFTEDNERLARATVGDLTYENMKEKCKKIFGDCTTEENNSTPQIKQEEVFYGAAGFRDERRWNGGWNNSNNEQSQPERRCFDCDSIKHVVSECPHVKRSSDNPSQVKSVPPNARGRGSQSRRGNRGSRKRMEQVHITLMSSDDRVNGLIGQTFGMAVVDSACTKTVAGAIWVDEYLSTLTKSQLKSVKSTTETDVKFKFGDGQEVKSIKRYKFPVVIGGECFFLCVEVVKNDIPLLLSSAAMKRGKMVIDFGKDTLTIGKSNVVKLIVTTSGHYAVPLSQCHPKINSSSSHIVLHCAELENLSSDEKYAKAVKLHRQLSHPTANKMLEFVRNSDFSDKEFMECVQRCCDECSLCLKYKKVPLKPVVSIPIATDFNQVVCMDLKEYIHLKVWIFHLIDASSRYSAACLINTKNCDVIVKKIFQIWICYFGSPGKILTDNGGEFSNDAVRELNEKLNVTTLTTAGESPFSNGIVERHNKVLYETMMKTKDEVKCSAEVALAWAVSSKNALQNNNGFSPNQLVFGRNTNLPTVLSDRLPALEPTTSSDIVRSNLQAIHSARKNFVAAENSDRIKRSLRHQVRTFSDVRYDNGDKVYYKRKNTKGWKGPGVVLGQDGKFVLVRHGGAYYRVHPCQLLHVKQETMTGKGTPVDSSTSNTAKESHVNGGTLEKIQEFAYSEPLNWSDSDDSEEEQADLDDDVDSDDSDDENDDEDQFDDADGDNNDENDEHDFDDNDEHDLGEDDGGSSRESNTDIEDQDNTNANERVDNVDHRNDGNQLSNSDDEFFETDEAPFEDSINDPAVEELSALVDDLDLVAPKAKLVLPKPKSFISFQLNSKNYKGTVLSAQPKRTGTNKHWVNVHLEGGEPIGVNWNDVEEWEILPVPENVVFYSKIDELTQEVVDAKDKEVQKLIANDVIEIVNNEGQKTISAKWVFTEKVVDNQKVVKARLVARGFEETDTVLRTDSPTISRQALRIVLVAIVLNNWVLRSLDIFAAFLQSKKMSRNLFLKPPPEMCPGHLLWKLKRPLYGLKDAPREWYKRLKEEIVKLGGKLSVYDSALYLWHSSENLTGVLISHVDDMMYGGTDAWIELVIGGILKAFEISKMDESVFNYIGIDVHQTESEIFIDQNGYIDSIIPIPISNERRRQVDEKLDSNEVTSLRSLAGQLLWVTGTSRPDMSFLTCQVSNYGKDPTVRKLVNANKAIKKLHSEKVVLRFPKLNVHKLQVLCYADAAHANLPTGASQGGFIIFLYDGSKVAPVTWQSKKLSRVTKSPLASEALALGDAIDSGYLIASLVREIFSLKTLPSIKGLTDNKSLTDTLHSTHIVQDPRLRVDIARLQEMIEKKELNVVWIPKEKQLADVATKQGACSAGLLDVLNTCSVEHYLEQ